MRKNLLFLLFCVVCFCPCYTFAADSTPVIGQLWQIPDLEMKLVYVSPGSFQMGSNDGEITEKPVHLVTFKNGYWIGKYEVTQNEYYDIMRNIQSNLKRGDKPEEMISWDDAVNFCLELTARERSANRLPDGYEYRLPTEAEWEFAARGGVASKGYKHSGSNNIDEVAWYYDNAGSVTHDVGLKAANELGIHDMNGNVWECCLDDWHDNYNDAPADGSRWGDGTGVYRVFRGGSWNSYAKIARPATRVYYSPGHRYYRIGFRVVLAPVLK